MRARRALGRLAQLLALCAVPGWACGCDGRERQQFCQLGAEHEVVRTGAKDLDGIELVAVGRQVLALWSEQGGLFVRWLGDDGLAQSASRRLGARCEGGIAAQRDGDALEVACLVHPQSGKHQDQGGVLVHRIGRDLSLHASRLIGTAGSLSAGVVMARGRQGLELAWHDGSPDAQRVWWGRLADAGASAQITSQGGRLASAPSLTTLAGSTVLSWAENWLEGGELLSRIVSWDRRSAPRTLVPLVHVAATPQLFAFDRELVLGFRDRRAHDKTGLYLAKVREGARAATAVRIGRADGVGRPALTPCMSGVVAATPRTYGGDYFVGVNWLDRDLRKARGEQQFYEDARAFTQVAAACVGSHALLLIAEFPQLHRDSMALRAVAYRCR
jgi:hypothetical protein